VKYLLFITALIFSYSVSYADFYYFDFRIDNYLVSEGKEINVELKYSLNGYDEGDFLIIPKVSNGIVEILNESTGEWISSYGSASDFPILKENASIRIKGLSTKKVEMFFEIRNKNNEVVYLTPKRYIWGEKVYENYLKNMKISKSIEGVSENNVVESFSSKDSGDIKQESTLEVKNDKKKDEINIPKFIYLILGLTVFLISSVLGFFYEKKRSRWNGKIL